MGLFDFFMSEEKKILKHTRRVTNRDAQPEDREASVRWLADNGGDVALKGLLQRFDMSLDHHLKDAGEKEFTFEVLASLGNDAVGPTRAWLKRCKHFAWPLKLYTRLTSLDQTLDIVYELLEIERKKDDFKPAKKKGLLVWLAEHQDDRAIEAAAPFLDDFDEGVRYAASEVLIAQHDDAAREPLLAVLADPEEESNRLRLRIAEIFAQRGWSVEGADAEVLGTLQGFTVKDGRLSRD